MRKATGILIVTSILAMAGSALAGGYDTPMLYSARHMGMGGAAIGYVNDPSAVFHNPAGLGHTRFISILGDFSPVMGGIQASPTSDINDTTELSFAPFFLVGASFRVLPWLTLGVGAYPVASSGGMYIYEAQAGEIEDETKLAFIEMTPVVAVNLPGNVNLGLAYRATLLQFTRRQQAAEGATTSMFDIELSGWSFLGFKAGVQWQPLPWLQVGFVYRHQTETEVSNDSSMLVHQDWGETTMTFTLPTKMGLGVRADIPGVGLGVAVDVEYGMNSQNEVSTIEAKSLTGGESLRIPSQFRWSDSVTVRAGLEYPFLPFLRGRLGYIFDGKTSNEQYPTAFGTPPTYTQVITGGLGYSFLERFAVNVAYAYRFGSTTITAEDVADREYPCIPCSHPGDYAINLHGIYLDFSVDL
ncbi:MAG: outer membrane protein transport protein [Bradymonadales bacterium]|nr:outer membrane protein transport protein [Bradymonadales bacterium]